MAVYFANGAGLTKVGYSHDPRSRVTSLQRLIPVTLRLVYEAEGGRDLETAVHREMTRRGRHEWREWFTHTTAGEAKSLVRLCRRRLDDATADGTSRLLSVVSSRVTSAWCHDVESVEREWRLDEAVSTLRRLQSAIGPTPAVESGFAAVFACRLGFTAPHRPNSEITSRLETATPATQPPEPYDGYVGLIDL